MKLQWLRDWWTGTRLARSVRRVSHCQSLIRSSYEDALLVMESRRVELTELQERIAADWEGNKKLMLRMEEALETSHAELRVAEKTVEALVAANKVLTDRWDAESAIEERRRMAASMSAREDV